MEAQDLMIGPVISIGPDSIVRKAARLMPDCHISCLPVVHGELENSSASPGNTAASLSPTDTKPERKVSAGYKTSRGLTANREHRAGAFTPDMPGTAAYA